MNKKLFSVNDIVEISLLCGLAIVLDRFVRIPIALTGGSINPSAIPLFIIALRHGPVKGFIASGLIYGLITCLLDGYGLNTYPFEYLVAFGAIALTGLLAKYVYNNLNKNNKDKAVLAYVFVALALTLWAIIRAQFASFDSMIFYDYSFKDSIIYNAPYVFISYGFDLIIIMILLYPINLINHLKPSSYLKNYILKN